MASVAFRLWLPVLARWVVPVAALVCAGAALAAGLDGAVGPDRTYGATSPPAAVADLVAGVGMIVAGAALWLVRPGVSGVLAVLIGCTWSADDWVGRPGSSPVARSAAMVVAPYLLALVVHLVVTWPRGRPVDPRARTVIVCAYAVTTVVALGQAVIRDPLFDLYCWRNCTDNTFLLRADVDAAQLLAGLRLWSSVVAGVLVVAVVCWRISRGTSAARTVNVPVLVPAALVATAEATYAAVLLRLPEEVPSAAPFIVVYYGRAAALTLLALGLTWTAFRTARTRRLVGRLAQDLADAPGPGLLRDVLAGSVGDDRLKVAYWLDGPQIYVDTDGRPADPRPARDQVVTTITRGDKEIAVVVHDRTVAQARGLKDEIGATARLAVENERLRAEVLFRLEDLRASQARVVARSAGEVELSSLLTWAGAETGIALAELRTLAHGIFPSILADAGLGAALQTFAEGASVPMDLLQVIDERVDQGVENAAYVVVVEVVADAVRRSASYVTVHVDHTDGHLVVALRDDGSERDGSQLLHVFDRVGALGGHMTLSPSVLRAQIPCE